MSLVLSGVSVRYSGRAALSDVSLAAASGEVLALLGPNGSGKSSLLRAIAGLVPACGAIRHAPDARLAYMPQDNAARPALTVFEVVLLGRVRGLALRPAAADLAAAAAALDELGLSALAERPIGALSGGQRQLVHLAQVLAGDPHVLLLDEPTSALDLAHQMQVLAHLRALAHRRNLVTIVALHDLNAAARCADRAALLHQGRLVASGAPSEILTAARIAQVYGVHVEMLRAADGSPVIVPLAARAPG